MNANEFDLDFDFEKEYGFELPKEEPENNAQEDFDLRAILESDFAEEAELFHAEYENDFDYGPEEFPLEEAPAEPDVAPEEPEIDLIFEQEPEMEEPSIEQLMEEDDLPVVDDLADEGFTQIPEDAEPAPVEEPAAPKRRERRKPAKERWNPLKQRPAPQPEEPKPAAEGAPRRKPVSKMRQFKNETLPLIIIGIAAVLIVFFVVGWGTRAITTSIRNNKDKQNASESKMNEEQRLALEAQEILDEAALLAAGYNYEAAIAKLNTYSGNITEHTEITMRLSEYKQTISSLIEYNDPGMIPNLSFHMLIADPSRAFTDQKWGNSYNKNFVTVDEFQKILNQLYDNGYVLVEMEHCVAETVTGDTVTYSAKPVLLPDGKRPVMITQTMVNYYNYMIDGNGDGTPDKDGAGFAFRLVEDDLTGKIQAEIVNASGETVKGDYDLVPILEKFIEEHPDFSYQGARATLAVTGDEGIFGYRINSGVKNSKGEDYYNQQVEGAKAIAQALRDRGYTIACYTYANVAYGSISATKIQVDLDNWKKEVKPVLGEVPILVYAKSSDISADGNYEGGKYNVLKNEGFRYFISSANVPYAEITVNYVRQSRIMVTGQQMTTKADLFSSYFNAKEVLNDQRGN